MRAVSAHMLAAACLASLVACGRKGPPLPPLVKIPVAPSDVAAERRGDVVDLQFTVPNANTDRSKPANVSRVDVYAFTGPSNVSEADVLKHGVKVATVPVKAPRDPNDTTDPDDDENADSAGDVGAPEGEGLDQGALAKVKDTLTEAARTPMPLPVPKGARIAPPPVTGDQPLLGPPPGNAPVRVYLVVGVATNGKNGPVSRRLTVPLSAPPAPPTAPLVIFTETEVAVSWEPSASNVVLQEPATGDVLPARPLGMTSTRLAYSVYEKPETGPETLLTRSPISEPQFSDTRMTWGATRCYVVRSVAIADTLSLESEPSAPTCVMLVDTFAPAVPKGLNAVAGSGEINLIWDPSPEPDLDGYIVLRGAPGGGPLTRITRDLLHDTTFHDTVPVGVRYAYAVQAVDKAGNVSAESERIEEAAR